jgi:hypothetical protein
MLAGERGAIHGLMDKAQVAAASILGGGSRQNASSGAEPGTGEQPERVD